MRRLASAALPLMTAACLLGGSAEAQHATAYDIEDGSRVFQGSCANCHGPDGDLIPGIDLGRGLFRRPLTDIELVGIILNGIPGTPMPPNPGMSEEQAQRVVAYLRDTAAQGGSGTATGDAGRGRAIFEGKGACLDCHRVGAAGSPTGPDLSAIGLARRAAELEASLLDPAAEVQPGNRTYTVTTRNGERVTGRLLNRDTFTVQLIDGNGRLRSFALDGLRDHGFAATPMPSVRGQMSAQEIADVVSYLVSLRGLADP